MRRFLASMVVAVALTACGPGVTPNRAMTARQALTSTAELLEFEPVQTRQDLFREIVRISEQEAGRDTAEPVLFPIIQDGRMTAAPALDVRADLLQAPDAVEPLDLTFDGRELWPEERRDSLQGLSEREAAELVARTLLSFWAIQPEGPVQVERAVGAPYAAAYVDGMLRVNPSLLYLAASVGPASVQPSLQ